VKRACRAACALGLGVMVLGATPASAGISLDMDYAAPAGLDVVLRWEAEGAGPFTLRTWDILGTRTVAEALAMEPAGEVALTGLTGGSLTLPGEMLLPQGVGMRAYQLVDEGDASCSNFGYVARRGSLTAESAVNLAIPERSSLRTLSAVLDRFPAVQRIEFLQPSRCRRSVLERVQGGRRGMDDFIPRGKGVQVTLSRDSDVVLVGASGSNDAGSRVDLAGAPCPNVPNIEHVSSPFGSDWETADDLLCGLEGRDWFDDDDNGRPDTCPGGVFDGVGNIIVTRGARHGAADFMQRNAGRRFGSVFLGGVRFGFDPVAGWSVGGGSQGRNPPSVTLAMHDLGAPASCRCADTDRDGDDDCSERLMGTDPDDPMSRGPDFDRDGVEDPADDCPGQADPLQLDGDRDGFGDACDADPFDPLNRVADPDGDGILDGIDVCPDVFDPEQGDQEMDGFGDACDNCPTTGNSQADTDSDGKGDECDSCPLEAVPDPDNDGICSGDNCPFNTNSDQLDYDLDGFGNECECADDPLRLPDVRGLRIGPVGGSAATLRRLRWQRDQQWGVELYDIRAGLLETMHSQRSLLLSDCVRSSVQGDSFVEGPVAGSRWYLVRIRTACHEGTLGEAGPPGGPNPRDVLIEASGWYCP